MAIKRTAKSLGTPVRRSVASAAMRHVDPMSPHQMTPGNRYLGWTCKSKSCGLLIAIAAPAGGKPASAEPEDQLAVLKCPHCGNEDLYRWSARTEHEYKPKGASA